MKHIIIAFFIAHLTLFGLAQSTIIIEHNCTYLYKIPASWIDAARRDLHIAYGHTSHGSQLISGMNGLNSVYGSDFAFNNGGSDGALDLHDYFVSGDLGNPDFTTWAARTREYLNNSANSDVNIVIWSWCGEVSSASQDNIDTYLNLMNQLEVDYPGIQFVYMTGHLDGTGENGNLNLRNEQIRTYCKNNNKILYDFADIESYDPDGQVNFMTLFANDNCDYDSDNNFSYDANWAMKWSEANQDSCFYFGDCAHSQALNCQQKGIAAWWLWARLAGWNGPDTTVSVTNITNIVVYGEGFVTLISSPGGTLQLHTNILPTNATNKSVTWSVQNGTGQASIDANGLLTAIADGTVTIKATANDGSGVSGILIITIENQNVQTDIEMNEMGPSIISFNKSEIIIHIDENQTCQNVSLYNILSNLIINQKLLESVCYVNVSSLRPGIYIIVLSGYNETKKIKVIIP